MAEARVGETAVFVYSCGDEGGPIVCGSAPEPARPPP